MSAPNDNGIKLGNSLKAAFLGLLNPARIFEATRIHRHHSAHSRTRSDDQLKLYAEILSGDFLHYGYFDDPKTRPENISLSAIERAQLRYAELFVERIRDKNRPVLDVGCGMGGLAGLLALSGCTPVALTPDDHQIAYIKKKYKDVELIHSKFEQIDAEANSARFGTVINSESLQYLDLATAVPLVDKILAEGGQWLICDYFKKGAAHEKSGHDLYEFKRILKENGFEIGHKQDITPNIAVTLRYIHMLANRMGMPVLRFSIGKLKNKAPAIHYLFEDFFHDLFAFTRHQIAIVDPDIFILQKRYLFLTVVRKGP